MANQYLQSASGAAGPFYVTNGSAGPGAQPVTFGTAGTTISPATTALVTSGPNEFTYAADTSSTVAAFALNGGAATLLPPNPSNSLDYLESSLTYVPFVAANGSDDVIYLATYIAQAGGLVNTLGEGWFISNGTASGTFRAVPGGSSLLPVPRTAAVSGNRVFVAGNDGTHGTQVWADDGTTAARLDPSPAGATGSYSLVGKITPFTTAAGVAEVAFIGNTGTASNQLFVSDGTAAGTHLVATPGLSLVGLTPALTASGSKVYFEASDTAGREEVWATDGTGVTRLDASQASAAGTYTAPGAPQPFTTASGAAAVAFTAQPTGAAANVQALYVSTGASATDVQQALGAGLTSYQLAGFAALPGTLIFAATDGSGVRSLWATSGGAASRLDPSANLAQSTYNGFLTGTSQPFTGAAGTPLVAFIGNVGPATNPVLQLFVSSGTGGAGTRELTVPGSSLVGQTPVASGGFAYALGADAAGNRQVYATNGAALTRLDPSAGADSYSDAGNLTTFTTPSGAAALAFTANAGTAAAPSYQLYVTDGTATGTRAVSTGAFQATKAPAGLTVNGSNVYFTATGAGGTQLGYVYDGTKVSQVTPAGSSLPVANFNAAQGYSLSARDAAKTDGLTGTTAYTFTITRSGNVLPPSVLSYAVAGSGTTPAPVSLFPATSGTVSFAPGGSLAILTVTVNGAALTADEGFTVTLGAGPGANGVVATDIQAASASGTIGHNTAPTPTPTPTPSPTPAPTPTPTPSPNPAVAAFVAAYVPGSAYPSSAVAAATAALTALAGAAGTVATSVTPGGSFGAAQAATLNAAVASAPAAGGTLALPAGYGALVAQGSGAVTLSDAGAAGAVLVGNGGGDTFRSTGQGATLIGGGADTINVGQSATVVTGTGGSTVVLGSGPCSVTGNGQDTVFGGGGADTVTAAHGLVAVGGAGAMTFVGGATTSLVFGGKGGVSYTAGSAFDIVVGIGGSLSAQGGAGGGEFFGNAGGDVLRAGSGQTVMVLGNGGQAVSTGAGNNFLVAGAGTAVLDGSQATGNDAFFGGTGQDTILMGAGNDLVGTGTGTSTVQVGSGGGTVFAFGTSTVMAGGNSGSATVVMGGAVTLSVAAGAARDFALFNFVPGTDRISLQGYDPGTVASALANQVNGGGQTVLTLGDGTVVQLIGVARADASFFG